MFHFHCFKIESGNSKSNDAVAVSPRDLSARIKSRRLPARASRRRGVAFVYTALGLTVALMVAAVVVDVGMLYQRKAAMQRAADSAALAGAYTLANFGTSYDAYISAGKMAARPENGGYTDVKKLPGAFTTNYVANIGNSKFIVNYPATDEQGLQHNNWFRVTLSRPEPALFSSIWPLNRKDLGVSASAVALYETLAPLEIDGQGTYGVAPGPVNLSVFGPNGRYSYGDCYSTLYLDDGKTANPNYSPNGYNFLVNVPTDQKKTTVEIFDPDCYNAGGVADASATRIDEFRSQTGSASDTAKYATTTQYSLYWDHGTSDPGDDVLIGTKSWGFDSTTDMQWTDAFDFDRSNYQGGNFRLNVKSTDGSSENGFDLRAGPTREETTTYTTETYVSGYKHYTGYTSQRIRGYLASGTYVDIPKGNYDFYDNNDPIYATRQVPHTTPAPDWDPNNGTTIQAEGHLPINFNISGTTKMTLGKVPPQAGGSDLIIRKFDTDINSKTITYTCDKLPGKSWAGTLSTDGTFATDTIRIPDSYRNLADSGTWYAEYVAGNQDTSVWDMSYTGNGPGKPGQIKLVR